jgi:hypothetical protein
MSANILLTYRNATQIQLYTKHYDKLVNFELRNSNKISMFSYKIIMAIVNSLKEADPRSQKFNNGWTVFRANDGVMTPIRD